jgi:putative ABC transport system substrate-binding protein
MNQKIFAFAVGALLCALWASAEAQQGAKLPRIGYLAASPATASPGRTEAFRQGLRELGYAEGKNVIVEYRWADGNPDRLAKLAAELARSKVDVIVTAGPTAVPPAKKASATIPIVMTFDSDPVGSGFVASLSRPGGNITGLSSLSPEISGKQLELLTEIIAKLSRVAVLGTSTRPGHAQAMQELELAARSFKLHLHFLDVQAPDNIEAALEAANKGRAEAALALGSAVPNSHRARIAGLAVKHRMPMVYDRSEFVDDGGLMSYGVSLADLHRRAATYVDKILKGARPADLPVEQPTKFDLLFNLNAAKQIALTIAPSVLARADRVIR